MAEPEFFAEQLPDGRTLIYTTDPSVVLTHIFVAPYGSTGVLNRAWIEASKAVGRQYTPREIEAGWPAAMEPHRLACLQHPQDSTGQTYVNTALMAACKSGAVSCVTYTLADYDGHTGQPLEERTEYAISAHDFAAWLAAQGEEPSPHIRAWFKANGVTPTAAPTAPETKEERQDRRLQACIDVGLPMENTRAVLHKMPDGIGRVAQQFGVTRQAFTADVKGALERRLTIEQGRRPR